MTVSVPALVNSSSGRVKYDHVAGSVLPRHWATSPDRGFVALCRGQGGDSSGNSPDRGFALLVVLP